jgi:DNA polymerase-1
MNLQNIWSSGEIGDTIRSLVTAPPGYKIVDIDLSNIEARVLAHYLSKVFGFNMLSEEFAKPDADLHQANANAWGCSRPEAKTLLFALLYGAGPGKIAIQLGCTLDHAKTLIEGVYAGMPIKQLKEMLWKTCRQRKGIIYTAMGRRLYYPHINSKDFSKRSQAERQTFNALLQGSAADVLKILTLSILPFAHGVCAFLAGSIHDELLFYCPEAQAPRLAEYLTEQFKAPLLSHCPIAGEAKIGNTWLEVH